MYNGLFILVTLCKPLGMQATQRVIIIKISCQLMDVKGCVYICPLNEYCTMVTIVFHLTLHGVLFLITCIQLHVSISFST